jgi:hypothetical protein
MQDQSFAKQFTKLFRAAIRQREYLNTTYRGQKNEMSMRLAIDELYPYLTSNFSDQTAASFLLKHQHTILRIIPGKQPHMITKINNLITVAKQFYTATSPNQQQINNNQ